MSGRAGSLTSPSGGLFRSAGLVANRKIRGNIELGGELPGSVGASAGLSLYRSEAEDWRGS